MKLISQPQYLYKLTYGYSLVCVKTGAVFAPNGAKISTDQPNLSTESMTIISSDVQTAIRDLDTILRTQKFTKDAAGVELHYRLDSVFKVKNLGVVDAM